MSNITKKWLEKHNACSGGIDWFCKQDKKNEIDVIRQLIKENLLDWANWTIVRRMKYQQYVRYAVYAAKQVIYIYEKQYPGDKRPRKAIEAAEKCIKDPAIKNKNAANAAFNAANAASHAASNAAFYATYAAAIAANAAANSNFRAAYAAAIAATYAASYAAYATAMKKKILYYGLRLLRKTL